MEEAPPTVFRDPSRAYPGGVPPLSFEAAFSVGHRVLASNYGVVLGTVLLTILIEFAVGFFTRGH